MRGFRQRSLHGGLRRLAQALRGVRSRRLPRSQRVFLVEIAGRRYKRVVFADSLQAREIGDRLLLFGPERVYPRLIHERENELWLEFVEGRALSAAEPISDERLDALAELLAVLYRRDARLLPLEQTRFPHGLETDLGFLRDVGVLADDLERELVRRAARVGPKEVWVGYDCTDLIAKNLVVEPDGRLRVVDVESLGAGQLLGTGVAKAALRWPALARPGAGEPALLERLVQAGAPDLRPGFPFAELCFRAAWLKNAFLEGKRRFVDERVLGALLERP